MDWILSEDEKLIIKKEEKIFLTTFRKRDLDISLEKARELERYIQKYGRPDKEIEREVIPQTKQEERIALALERQRNKTKDKPKAELCLINQ